MALEKAVQDALAKIADATYRDGLTKVFEANPTLATSWLENEGKDRLRLADYSSKMNALKETEGQQQIWWKANKPKIDNLTAENLRLKTEHQQLGTLKTDLERKVTDLQARVDSGDFSATEDRAMVNEIRGLKATIDSLQGSMSGLVNEEKLKSTLDQRGQEFVDFIDQNTFEMVEVRDRFRDDFKKPLSRQDLDELYKYAGENGIRSLQKAYDSKFGQQIKEMEIEKIREEERKKVTEELAAKPGVIPASPGASISDVGPLQRRFQGTPTSDNGSQNGSQALPQTLDEAIAMAANSTRTS